MDRNFLKQSIRRELDYYKDGLFNEDEDEYWERAWAAPDDDDSMAENGFLNVAMAHLQGDECDEIVLLGTEYGYHEPDYDSYIDMDTPLSTIWVPVSCRPRAPRMTGNSWLTILRKFWLERRSSFPLSYPHCCG